MHSHRQRKRLGSRHEKEVSVNSGAQNNRGEKEGGGVYPILFLH